MRLFSRFSTAVAVITVATTVALSPGALAQETVIRIGFSSTADLTNDNGMSAWVIKNYLHDFAQDLRAEVHGSSQLGSDQDVLQALQLGSGATMFIGGTALLNVFHERTGVLDLPFLWRDYDHVGRVLDGEVGEALAEELEQSGFKILGWGYSWGYRNVVTAREEVSEPEDIAGLKLRTIQSPMYVAAVNAMGANATPMAFGELYTALQTGVLDGFEHAASMVYSTKMYEVSNYVALTRHLFGPTVIAYSLPLWNQLTEQQQQSVREAVALAIDINRALAPQREAEALALLEEVGMTIHEIDTEPFREKAVAVQDDLAASIGATDLLKIIRAQ